MALRERFCDTCGVLFRAKRNKNNTWNFCSKQCLTAARIPPDGVIFKSRKSRPQKMEICPTCNSSFATYVSEPRKFCSKECVLLARRSGGEISNKVEETTSKNHGVRRFFENKERFKRILQEKYGVDYITQLPGLGKLNFLKAHETKKKKGTYAFSKIERDFSLRLKEQNVSFETQVVMFGKPIDFKIGDIYLQIDGRYWHGLDRPLEEIKQSSAGRDKSIYQRWYSDRAQDEQFAAAGLRLVRITDKEAKEWLRDKKLLLETLTLKSQETSMLTT